jgi:hypothetical protein
MSVDLADYEKRTTEAVQAFWGNREKARQKQIESGKRDQGERASVTAGKNMDGFIALMMEIVRANGLSQAEMRQNRRLLTLPGFFRPTKLWDLLVVHQGQLVAALEFKSHVGSFGNNFNNRAEEAIGSAHDFWTAYREGAFGQEAQKPFLGWLIMIEDTTKSQIPVKESSIQFPIFPEFKGTSYADRYNILCRKLVQEQLYTAAAFLRSPRSAVDSGNYEELGELTSLRTFVTSLAGHIAATAARIS